MRLIGRCLLVVVLKVMVTLCRVGSFCACIRLVRSWITICVTRWAVVLLLWLVIGMMLLLGRTCLISSVFGWRLSSWVSFLSKVVNVVVLCVWFVVLLIPIMIRLLRCIVNYMLLWFGEGLYRLMLLKGRLTMVL